MQLNGNYYNVTCEPITSEKKWETPIEIEHEINPLLSGAKSGKKSVKARLEQLIAAYPHLPRLRNFLCIWYTVNKQHDLAAGVNDELLRLFPDYLFGITTKVRQLLKLEKLEEAKVLLGESMDIGALYPHRHVFHISEYRAYTSEVVEYLARTKRYNEAYDKIELLRSVDVEDDLTSSLEKLVSNISLQNAFREITEEHKSAIKAKCRETISLPQYETIIAPSYPDFEFLFDDQWKLDTAQLKHIIENKKEHLIAECCHVINSAISGFEYISKKNLWTPAVLHVLLIFPYLDDELAFNYLLQLLREPDKCWKYWCGDWDRTILVTYFKIFSKKKSALLSRFIKEKEGNTSGKITLLYHLSMFLENSQGTRQELVDFMIDLFQFFKTNRDDDTLFDSELVSFLVISGMDLRMPELEDVISEYYENGWLYKSIVRSMEYVKTQLHSTVLKDYSSRFHNDVYEHLASMSMKMDEMERQEAEEKEMKLKKEKKKNMDARHIPGINLFANTSRNVPCPCGSGKKYKRCHGAG